MNEGLGLWITFSILHYGYTEYLLNIKSLSIRYLSNIASCVMKFFTLPSLIPPGHLPPKLSLFVKMEKSHFITSLCSPASARSPAQVELGAGSWR